MASEVAHNDTQMLIHNKYTKGKAFGLLFGCFAIGVGTGLGLLTSKYGDQSSRRNAGLIGFLGFYIVSITGIFIYFAKKTSRKCNNAVYDMPQDPPRETSVPEFTDMVHAHAWEKETERVQKIVEIVKSHTSSSGSDDNEIGTGDN